MKLYNTGAGLKEGAPDPHWQIVARTDDPNFEPRPAVVTGVNLPPSPYPPTWLPNDPARSQWISTGNGPPDSPNDVTYTFRTTFDLAGLASGTAAVLRGQFIADNHVNAVRLNGQSVPVPEHGYTAPFEWFEGFTADRGFVAGTNTLEVDVLNGEPGISNPPNPMLLRVELEGFFVGEYRSPARAKDKPAAESRKTGTSQ